MAVNRSLQINQRGHREYGRLRQLLLMGDQNRSCSKAHFQDIEATPEEKKGSFLLFFNINNAYS